ncbi:MAG: Biopolymer transport protein ExbB [Planctomycetota bacterium]
MPAFSRSIRSLFFSRVGRNLSAVSFMIMMSSVGLAQEPAAEAAAAPASENMLIKTWQALGTMYAITFLIMSIILVALVVRAILAVQKNNFVPDDLVQGVEASLSENNPQAAAELLAADESFLGTLLNSSLPQLSKGKEAALDAMQVAGDAETMKIEHLIGYIALIGNISPMVGLLGTVQGMVKSFGTIASSQQTPKPSALAGGIEQALYTTLVGLYLAIPAIVIYNILRNMVQKQIMQAGSKAEQLLERFEESSK